MSDQVQFETPENIQVAYQLAGPGTRFVAWFIDQLLIFIFVVFLAVFAACAGISTESALRDLLLPSGSGPGGSPFLLAYFYGIWLLAWGLGSFFYFGCSEFLLKGQTLGKRQQKIRVVKEGGFSLDAGSVFVRSLFRVLDHMPPLWIVPVVSAKSQRLGDMVAGTLVILDKPEEMNRIRDALSGQSAVDSTFRFDAGKLKRVRPQDIETIERILERWADLGEADQVRLLNQVIPPLVERLQTETPTAVERVVYLEDLLAAEYRRQDRNLGVL